MTLNNGNLRTKNEINIKLTRKKSKSMKILIGGDSWSRGEWGCTNLGCDGKSIVDSCKNNCMTFADTNYGIRHSGLKLFLSKDHNVTNVGAGGLNYQQSIYRVEKELKQNNYDIIFFFVTEALREESVVNYNGSLSKLLLKQQEFTHKAYDRLSKLHSNIYLIGGSNKVDVDYAKKVSLKVLIESIPEWISNNELEHWTIYASHQLIDYESEKLSMEVIDFLLHEINLIENASTSYPNYFKPDGRHLNRVGHEKLFKYIMSLGLLE